MPIELPARCFVFWPVGTGDSTTIKVNDNYFLQVDLHQLAMADDEETPVHPVIDSLLEVLPLVEGVPYLAVYALTHADLDHCKGTKRLFELVAAGALTVGELWFTPRVLRDYAENAELSEDAQAFCDEAMRRVQCINDVGEAVESGDRVRVIGNDDVLDEEDFVGLPDRFKSRPGDVVTILDGADLVGSFQAYLHAPFGDDSTRERNKTSLGMQVTVTDGEASGRVMLLGDLDYPPLQRIFIEYAHDADDTAWDVFLAPHHCSKSAMYFQDEGDTEEVLKQDLLDAIEEAGGEVGWIVASSGAIPASNEPGDNPPHAIAKQHYEAIAPTGFLCTGEDPDEDTDEPIVFTIESTGISLWSAPATGGSTAAAAVASARGGKAAEPTRVGFGRA